VALCMLWHYQSSAHEGFQPLSFEEGMMVMPFLLNIWPNRYFLPIMHTFFMCYFFTGRHSYAELLLNLLRFYKVKNVFYKKLFPFALIVKVWRMCPEFCFTSLDWNSIEMFLKVGNMRKRGQMYKRLFF
jgi:hypothetical protein